MAGYGLRRFAGEEEEEQARWRALAWPPGRAEGMPVATAGPVAGGVSYGNSSTIPGAVPDPEPVVVPAPEPTPAPAEIDPGAKRLLELERHGAGASAQLKELRRQQAAWAPQLRAHEAARQALEAWNQRGWYLKGKDQGPSYWERWDARGQKLPAPTPEEVQAHEQAGREARQRFLATKREHDAGLAGDEELKRRIAVVEEAEAELEFRRDRLQRGLPEISMKQARAEEERARERQEAAVTHPKTLAQMSVAERAAAQPVGGLAGVRRNELERRIARQQEAAQARRAQDPRDEGTRKRQQRAREEFRNVVMFPDTWIGGKHGKAERSPEEIARLLVNRYLEIEDGRVVRDPVQRDQRRDELARTMGVEPGNDRAITRYLREDAWNRRRQDSLMESAAAAAMANRALHAAGIEGGVPDYEAWRDGKQGRKSFKENEEPDYYYAWRSTGEEMEKRLQPIAGKLEEAYREMQMGNLALGRFYHEVEPKDRELFLSALRMVAERMPSKDGDTVWGQVVKSNERFWRDTGSAMADFAEKPFDTGPPIAPLKAGYTIPLIGGWLTERERKSYEEELKQYRENQLKRSEVAGLKAFRDDINRINDQNFDPIRALKTDGWWSGMLEQAAYGAPATLGTVGMSLLPGGWVPLAIKTQADTHRDLRHYLKDHGVEDGRAGEMADNFSLALTVPMVALDRLQAGGMGKLPFFEAAMKNTAGRIRNGALGAATGTALRVGQMQAGNMLQEPLPELAKEAMHALQKDVPGADWERFFSGYWTRQASTMAQMLPLAVAAGAVHGIGRGIDEKAQVKQLMSRSDTELAALGIRLEYVKAFRAAGDDVPRAREAFREGLRNLDPQGETARTAVRELEQQVDAQQRAARAPEVAQQDAKPQGNPPQAAQQALAPDAGIAQRSPEQEAPARVPEGPMREAEPQNDPATVRPPEDAGAQGQGEIRPRQDSPAGDAGQPEDGKVPGPAWRTANPRVIGGGDGAEGGNGPQTSRRSDSPGADAQAGAVENRADEGASVPLPARRGDASQNTRSAEETSRTGATNHLVDEDQAETVESSTPALPPRDAAPQGESPPVTPADVHAAATAPDARQRLGNVKAGSLHALEAYRFFSGKQEKQGRLNSTEQATFERAELALAEAVEKEKRLQASSPGTASGGDGRGPGIGSRDAAVDSGGSASQGTPGIRGSLDPEGPPARPEELRDSLVDSIGEERLRLEQPGVPYEQKRQLLLDFATSVLGRGDGAVGTQGGGTGTPSRSLAAIQVLQARWARELSIDPQVRFIGERIDSVETLARKAQALRNPLFETFYLLPVDRDGKLLNVMAITSRVPCSATVAEAGQTAEQALQAHASFLQKCGAAGYYMLHNHPTGDPTSSNADKSFTRKHATYMRSQEGLPMLGHVVINHETYTVLDEHAVENSGKIHDPGPDRYAMEPLGLGVNEAVLNDIAEVAKLGKALDRQKSNSELLTGFIADAEMKVAATLEGVAPDFLRLTRKQLQDFSRRHGGAHLLLYAKRPDHESAKQLIRDFQEMNAGKLLQELVVEYPEGWISGLEEGNYEFWRDERFFGGEDAPGRRVQQGRRTTTDPGDGLPGRGKIAGDSLADDARTQPPRGHAAEARLGDAAPLGKRLPVTRAELHAAAMAPDARRRWGGVKAGTLHALEAYRFLSGKQQKLGRLSPAEQATFERAELALAEAMEKEK